MEQDEKNLVFEHGERAPRELERRHCVPEQFSRSHRYQSPIPARINSLILLKICLIVLHSKKKKFQRRPKYATINDSPLPMNIILELARHIPNQPRRRNLHNKILKHATRIFLIFKHRQSHVCFGFFAYTTVDELGCKFVAFLSGKWGVVGVYEDGDGRWFYGCSLNCSHQTNIQRYKN